MNITTKTAILALAAKSRQHIACSENYRNQIQQQLLKLFPSLEGKAEDGTEDWSCDVINCENESEVLHVLSRIESIEKKKLKTFKLNVLENHLNKLQTDMTKLEKEIAQVEAEFQKLSQD